MRRRWIVAAAFVIGVSAVPVGAQERVEEGRRAFTEQGCYGCHTVKAFGTPIGPDLSRVGAKYSETYLTKWLRDPAEQRPAAHMPKLELTDTQIAALAAFLSALR